MVYDVPGRVDQLSADLVQKWNEAIQAAYANLQPDFGSRFFTLDPSTLTNPIPAPIKWFGDPAEPNFCLGFNAMMGVVGLIFMTVSLT